jgi:hypothetical protein
MRLASVEPQRPVENRNVSPAGGVIWWLAAMNCSKGTMAARQAW